jgi:hypothetical protein
MKNYEVHYIKGHLVDKESGKRILLKRGGTFNILADDDQFEEIDELVDFHLEKVGNANDKFFYRIGLSKETSEDRAREFYFNAIIREDLYLKSKNGKDWTLCPCLCLSSDCLEGEMQMIESVPGTSLSNLFANVVTFYFAFQRSTACNAFTTFYFMPSDYRPFSLKYNGNYSLDQMRNQIAKKYNENG